MSVRRGLLYTVCCGALAGLGLAANASAQGSAVTVNLASQNNSGISGTASFSELGGGRTTVDIKVNGAGAGPEPAHIHQGTCAQLDPTPQFSLANVTNGTSTTEVTATLAQLSGSPHAVHMHKSPDELTVYVACADLVPPGTLPRLGDAAPAPDGLIVGAAGLSLVG